MKPVGIQVGRTGRLGLYQVGVVSVRDLPSSDPRSLPVRTARLVLAGGQAEVEWESTIDVHEHDAVPGGNGLYRVLTIASRSAPGRAEVMLATTPSVRGNPNDPDGTAIVLAEAGSLRIGGPRIETAWDLRVTRWMPDLGHPQRVSLEWWPAVFGRADADPALIRQADADPGARIAVGGYHLSVLALRGQATDRAAWVEVSVIP